MTRDQLKSLVTGMFGIIAAKESVYKTVEVEGIPSARAQARGSHSFEKDILFACDLLTAKNAAEIHEILVKKE